MAETTITLIRTSIEVPDGSGSYRWVNGYYVVDPLTGNKIYPPVQYREAIAFGRELAGPNCKFKEQER